MNQALAGIDIGGTKIAIALANLDGEILAKRRSADAKRERSFCFA